MTDDQPPTTSQSALPATPLSELRPSVLRDVFACSEKSPKIRLRLLAGESETESAVVGDPTKTAGKYLLGASLGRGGIGEVVRGHDQELGREVALKFLRADHQDKAGIVRRFIEEAQIGAQLQHPGIVPVYDLGTSREGLPYFAMKLVRGRTFAELLAERATPASDRPKFLQIFLQVCQAIAFANARGVVHRDLKPGNVMVGRFGEVQVVDWGLSKLLGIQLGGPSPSARAAGIDDSPQRHHDSVPGAVLGTPAYMPPEQASGDVDQTGPHSDVFGLGAILCEILTGNPPYLSDESDATERTLALLRLAARAALDDAVARLEGCDADPALRTLCRKCLSPTVGGRPADAEAVAQSVAAHLSAVEDRAQQARIEVAVGRRQQRLLSLIVAVVVLALAVTAWLWYAADAARSDAVVQRSLANAENRRFRLLGYRSRLDQALFDAGRLHPPWPEQAPRLANWLEQQGRPLAAAIDEVRVARDELRRQALDSSADGAAAQALRRTEIEPRQTHLTVLRRARAMRSGEIASAAEPVEVDAATKARDLDALNSLAWERVAWDAGRKVFGEEAFALAVARYLVDRARAEAVPAQQLAANVDTLAWALVANGFDAEARTQSEAAVAICDSSTRAGYEDKRRQLEARIEAASGEAGLRMIETLERDIARYADLALDERNWRFADESQHFLHRTLQGLVRDLETLRDPSKGALADVEVRLAWAKRIEELTLSHPMARTTWTAAADAVRAADGITASTAYASHPPLELKPQVGLVPIGMNPKTLLWEFYDLRSAYDHRAGIDAAGLEIPAHDPRTGAIAVGDDTGIVFALLPGGTPTLGAQKNDESSPNYDPLAERDERVRQVTLGPFFLGRHELTQAQWRRLNHGDEPSYYSAGDSWAGERINGCHPVEQVDWLTCTELLGQHALRLPNESEWEHACRAGTDTPWFVGRDPAHLREFANVADVTTRQHARWTSEDWADGRVVHAPVGSFLANPWGLHDVHGNVWEWCSDVDGSGIYVARGGSFDAPARNARASARLRQTPSVRRAILGVRPARSVIR